MQLRLARREDHDVDLDPTLEELVEESAPLDLDTDVHAVYRSLKQRLSELPVASYLEQFVVVFDIVTTVGDGNSGFPFDGG